MEFTLADQTIYFLYSLLFGVMLSALYDVVVVIRMLNKERTLWLVLLDVIYMSLCAVLTVLFALPFNKGAVRYFVLFGEIIGFIVYRFTLGGLSERFYSFIIRIINAIIKKSLQISRVFLHKVLKINRFVVYNVRVILYKTQNIVCRNIVSKKKRKCYEHKEGK